MNQYPPQTSEQISERFQEIAVIAGPRPEVQADTNRFRDLSREYAQLGTDRPVLSVCRCGDRAVLPRPSYAGRKWLSLAEDAGEDARATLLKLEPRAARPRCCRATPTTSATSISKWAVTGGAEAALFAGDLLRMYLRYAERRRWKTR